MLFKHYTIFWFVLVTFTGWPPKVLSATYLFTSDILTVLIFTIRFFYKIVLCFRLLVSGSDDFNIIVWEALKYRLGCKINSGHSGNIFSVKVDHLNIFIRRFTWKAIP